MKYKLIMVGCIIVILTGIYIYKDASLIINTERKKSYILQENNHTIGYHNGKKIFDIQINNVRQNAYQNVLYADQLIDGEIYNQKNNRIISNLIGYGGRINTKIKSILVTNNITAKIHPTTSTQSVQ